MQAKIKENRNDPTPFSKDYWSGRNTCCGRPWRNIDRSRRGQAFDKDKGKDGKSPRYTVIDLGTLGGTYSFGFGINNAGDVAGAAATQAQTDGFAATAFLWTKQKGITNLGTLGPPAFPACPTCNSGAAGVGASGEVAQ